LHPTGPAKESDEKKLMPDKKKVKSGRGGWRGGPRSGRPKSENPRTERSAFRMTPAIATRLKLILNGESLADWIERKVKEEGNLQA